MNPSATGWIDKFGQLTRDVELPTHSFTSLYQVLKKTGFVFGINVGIPPVFHPEHELGEDEKAKINLLTGLYCTHALAKGPEATFEDFVQQAFSFYKQLDIVNLSFMHKLFGGKGASQQLEAFIESRVFVEESTLAKTFRANITNSLLFVDLFAFWEYLKGHDPMEHAQLLEYVTINIVMHALGAKEQTESDQRLVQLLSSSLTYTHDEVSSFDGSYRDMLAHHFSEEEKNYFLDLACLTVWEDNSMEHRESEFLYGIGKDLGFAREIVSQHIEEISGFLEAHEKFVPHLQDHSLAYQFYGNMSKMVRKLILRNSKRLLKELNESKELVGLLSQAAIRELTPEEKKKIQNQLLDICKSIPSLAIFMLPGGAVLLPIFIRLIPKLLPSAFDENRVEK